VSVAKPFGYLSSYIAESRGYGSLTCPWHIELQRGQRINITLIDFTTPRFVCTAWRPQAWARGDTCTPLELLWSVFVH